MSDCIAVFLFSKKYSRSRVQSEAWGQLKKKDEKY
jgi:hypothetical protein